MKRIYNLSKIRNTVASMGVFDGVHRGHQRILKKLVREAAKEGAKSLVITFHPHPQTVLNSGLRIPFLTSLGHRLSLIKELGVDFFIIVKFTKSFSRIKPDEFTRDTLVGDLNIKGLVVGEDFLFGRRGKGDLFLLKRLAKLHGFKLFGVRPVMMEGRCISSTRIRRAIEKGDLKNAALMLGRPVTVLGTVVRGRGIGKKIGFPTANINPHNEAIPPSGVYSVDVKLEKKIYKGVLNIGTRPTFGGNRRSAIELYVFNFRKEIYHKDIEIMFKKKMRDEERFDSVGSLRRQIKLDILRAR